MYLTLTKFISVVENVFCVHRNVFSSSKLVQVLIFIHVIYEITMISLNVALHELYDNSFELTTEEMYFITSNCYSIMQIILAVLFSKAYKSFKMLLDCNNSKCSVSGRYQKKINETQKVAVFGASLLSVMQVLFFTYFRFVRHFDIPISPRILLFIFHTNLCMCDFRYGFQFIVLYSYLRIIAVQLENIVECVEKFEVRNRGMSQDTQEIAIEQADVESNIFDEWCIRFIQVVETSRLFNKVFGTQMTLMFTTMVFYYIIFLYSLTSLSVLGTLSPIGFGFYVFDTVFLLFELVMLTRAAQCAENNANKLRQRLACLLANSLDSDSFKPAKDLLRLVSTRPVHTQAYGSIPVDMTLVPTCIILFTYYTVIALQFNNVL